MKIQELRNLSRMELEQKEKGLKVELYKLNLQRYAGRVEKPHLFSLIKRDIARIQTLLNATENTKAVKKEIKASEQSEEKKE